MGERGVEMGEQREEVGERSSGARRELKRVEES
jgi:hypothetical protein